MIRLTGLGLGIVLIGIWFVLLRPVFLGGPLGTVMVEGISMEPTYYSGDLVLTRKHSSYTPGDIVAYRIPKGEAAGGDIVIHRIVGGNSSTGYDIRGDNKTANDPWRPMPSAIVGKAWIHLPGVGSWINYLKRPLPFGLLTGFIAAGGFIGKSKVQRRRRNGRWKNMGKQDKSHGGLPAPTWLIAAFSVLCVLAAVSAFVASQAFSNRTQQTETVTHLSYDVTSAYDYTARVEASSLYPAGVIGPVTTDAAKDVSTTIYTESPPALDLGLKYELKPINAPPALNFTGTISAVAQITSGEKGWTKTIDILPSTPFTGTATSVRLPVDLEQIQTLIQTIEIETKYTAPSYDVAITPTVHITGNLGTNAIDDTYAPPFKITLTKSQVTLDPSLVRSETRKQEDNVTTPQSMNMLGLSASVARARWISASIGLAALTGAVGLAAMMWLGIGRGEAARIRARYGSMVISVADAALPSDPAQQIRLASIQDLVRLANKDSRMVFHQARPDGSDVYFVQDGSLTYLYRSQPTRMAAASSKQEA